MLFDAPFYQAAGGSRSLIRASGRGTNLKDISTSRSVATAASGLIIFSKSKNAFAFGRRTHRFFFSLRSDGPSRFSSFGFREVHQNLEKEKGGISRPSTLMTLCKSKNAFVFFFSFGSDDPQD